MESNKEIWVLGHKIIPQTVSGDYDMVIGETPPNVPGPPPHFHSALNELFLVLEGELEFNINGERRVVKKGESVDFAPNSIHTFRNASDIPCKWLNIHSPKGFLSFFEKFGVEATQKNAMKKSTDESLIQKVMQDAANYDMIIEMK